MYQIPFRGGYQCTESVRERRCAYPGWECEVKKILNINRPDIDIVIGERNG